MLKDKRCLGVTWYGEQLQCVLLEKMMQGIVVVDQWRCLASEDLSQYALFKKTNACLGLPHQAVASARIELPSDTLPKTMTAHIELKSEALFQKKYDDLIIEYEREGLGQDKQQWQLYAIEKTILQRYLEKLMPSSVRLLWIEPEMQGLARLAFFCQAQSKIISVMNLEHNILSVAVLFEGKIKLKRVVPVASDQVDDVAEALNLLCLEIMIKILWFH